MQSINKKIYTYMLVTVLGVVMGFFSIVHGVEAQEIQVGLQEVGEGAGLLTASLPTIIFNVIRSILGLLGIIAVSLIIYAGFTWMTAGADAGKVEKARKILINAGIGLAIILTSVAIVTWIFNALGGAGLFRPQTISRQSNWYEAGSGALGGGIIQSHYPSRNAVDVPRNTQIVLSFKEEVNINQIIDCGADGTACTQQGQFIAGPLRLDGVMTIFHENENVSAGYEQNGVRYELENVRVSTPDNGKTFVFAPQILLGSSEFNVLYGVGIDGDLEKANGRSAFGNLASTGEFAYSWGFEVSTKLDVTPPTITSVIPFPDTTNPVPRNMIVQINFSEPINPLTIGGVATVTGGFGIIETLAGGARVAGTYTYGNNYTTVEFVTNELCGTNSCGESVFCLPANAQMSVLARSATLAGNQDLPFQASAFDGIVDMASNTLDGNKNKQADGRDVAAAYTLNDQTGTSDSVRWNFRTSNEVDLVPPRVSSYFPVANETAVDPTGVMSAQFDKLLSATTVKPNANYGDGFCGCMDGTTPRNDWCNAGEICSSQRGYCVSETTRERAACYTYDTSSCKLDRDGNGVDEMNIKEVCVQTDHVTVDQDPALTGANLGPDAAVWYTPATLNTLDQTNVQASYSTVRVTHGRFLESGVYGLKYGSGIKDIFQNCYIPSDAPSCIRVSSGQPGQYQAGSSWYGTFPTCDLTGATLTTQGLFGISYQNPAGQNRVVQTAAFAWDQDIERSIDDRVDESGNRLKDSAYVIPEFGFLTNLLEAGTSTLALYYDIQTSEYIVLLASRQQQTASSLRNPITATFEVLDLVSVQNFPSAGLVSVGGDEVSYTGIDTENRRLTGVTGIDGEYPVGTTVQLIENGTLRLAGTPVTSASSVTMNTQDRGSVGVSGNTLTLTTQWNNTALTQVTAVRLGSTLPQTLTITPSLETAGGGQQMRLRFLYPGGVIELPTTTSFQIIDQQ